jgi:SAM-dependent methyltransferase
VVRSGTKRRLIEPTESTRGPARFRAIDPYRARREWQRYEGTAQRDLYRELRERFLVRHVRVDGWTVDVGCGPGRFLPFLGDSTSRRVAVDISRQMLLLVPGAWIDSGTTGSSPDLVLADALQPPFVARAFQGVVVLGNTLGFQATRAERLLDRVEEMVAPGGVLILEIAPGPGERSRYLARLPASSVGRLFRAPVRAILPRVDREGFRTEHVRRDRSEAFRRFSVREVHERFFRAGWELLETIAVAPALGPDAERAATIREEPSAWTHLLELEEEIGRRPGRWGEAAAVLVAVRCPSSKRMIK